MAADQQFCLRWNNHQSTLVSVFDTLLEKGALVDCTIAAEGQSMKAHKVVLSACSPYFETLLSEHYEKHPIIILKDVKFQELRALMDYMYRGEVNILQDQLASLLKVAESLQIKGLSDSGGGDERETMQDRPEPKKQSAEPKKQSAPTRPQPISRSRLETENRRPSTGFSNPNEFPVASPPSTPKTPSRNECSSPIARKRKKVPENSLNDLDTSSGFDGYDNSSSNELPPQKPTVPRTPMKPVPPATKQPVPLKPVVEKSAPSTFTQVESPRPKPTQTPSAPIEQDVKPPKLEPPAEVYIQPKTEFVEEEEEEIEDLTLDDEDDFDMSDQAMAGPSHGGDGSNQGFLQWHDQSQDEMFSAAQEAIGGQKDSQDDCTDYVFDQVQTVFNSLVEKVKSMEIKLDVILKKFKTNTGIEINVDAEDHAMLSVLPIKKIEDFHCLEKTFNEDKDFKTKLINLMITLDGKDYKSLTANILRRVMSDEVAMNFSYTGKKTLKDSDNKDAFSKTHTCKSIHAAVKKAFKEEVTDTKIKNIIGMWLQQAKTRSTRKAERRGKLIQKLKEKNFL